MGVTRRITALALAVTLAAPAVAQDGSEPAGARSPESAQRFLAEVLVRPEPLWHGFMIYRVGAEVSDTPGAGAALVSGGGRIKSVTADGACRSRLALDQAQVTQRAASETSNLRIGGGHTERLIDWSEVEAVTKTESDITTSDASGQVTGTRIEYGVKVGMQGGWQALQFDLPAQSERDRLAFAIEFLKSACELKSDTGF